MSLTAFGERISKKYHKPSDEIETFDLDYEDIYRRAYIRSAESFGKKNIYLENGEKFKLMGNDLYKK